MNKTAMMLMTIFSLLSTTSFAAGTSSTKQRKLPPSTYNYDPDSIPDILPSSYIVNGFNLGFEYLSVNSFQSDIKSKVTGNLEKDVKKDLSKVAKQVGLKVGYKRVPRGGLGFDLNLSVLKMESRPEGTADLTTLVPSANFIVAAPKIAYGAFGVNTSIIAGDNDGTQHSPHIGYQVGGGLVIQKNFNFEVFYNWINQGIESQYALTEERVTATNARLIYAF